jgi:hypothetical protein
VTGVSGTVFFKHQYITNPQVTPKTLFIKAALELTSALKGSISCDGKMAEVLKKFSKLFTKIATTKTTMAKAKSNETTSKITSMPAELSHFQGGLTDHLPGKPTSNGAGCSRGG